MERLSSTKVQAHIVGRIRESLELFDVRGIAVYPESFLKDDLQLITNCDSSPYDVLFQFLVDDFAWAWVSEEDEGKLITVHDLVDYFCVHYTDEGLAVDRLRHS